MLTLFAAVVGDKFPFSVKIDASENVHALKKKIMEEIPYDGCAMYLQLYLAKTPDGTWLNSNDAKDVALDEEGNLQHYKMMNPTHFINRYFKATDLAEELIHVLVVVQDGEVGPVTGKRSNEEIGDILEERMSKFIKKGKKSEHLSTMDSIQKRAILDKTALNVRVLQMKEPIDESIPVFKWNGELAENQENQRAQYMAYLSTQLGTLLDEFLLLDIANDKSVLDTKDPRLPFQLSGTADILLVDKSMFTDMVPLSGLCLVIELKKKVEKKHLNQAIGQLVCASIKAPLDCYPMSLLTDLNGRWFFSFLSDKNVLTHVEFRYPKNAIDFIKATIVDQSEDDVLPLPYLAVPFKKLRVDDFLPRPVDGHAAEMMENFELMADELEPEFLIAKRAEYAQHLFFSQARVFQDITKPIVATEDLAAGQTIFQEIAIVSSGFGHSFDDCGCHGDDEPVEAHVEPETLDEDDLETVSPAVVQEFDALMSYCEGHPVLSMVDIRKNLFKLLRLYELDATSLTLLLTLEINKEEASEYLEAATGLRREHPSIIPPGLSDDDVAHLIGLLNNKYCHALEEIQGSGVFIYMSLLAHSCLPNCNLTVTGNTMWL
ncbi:hypothetical protein AeRB84_019269, partial [Aphanomyces euteiches]